MPVGALLYVVHLQNGFFGSQLVMDDAFVDIKDILHAPKIEATDSSDYLDVVGLNCMVVKGTYHGAWDVQKVGVDQQGAGRCTEIFLETMGRGSVSHECTAQLGEVLSTGNDLGHFGHDGPLEINVC